MLRFFSSWTSRSNMRSKRVPFVTGGDGRKFFPSEPKEDVETTVLIEGSQPGETLGEYCVVEGYEAVEFDEDEMLAMLDSVESDQRITSLCFERCELTPQVKNKLTALLPHRNFIKIGFNDCGLDSEDILWLNYILSHSYAAESITLVESFDKNEMVQLYQNFPKTNLRCIGLKPDNLEELKSAGVKLSAIELVSDEALSYEHVRQLFELIRTAKIQSLIIPSFKFTEESAYKLFMNNLRTDTNVRSLSVGDYPRIEADLFALLNTQNSTLSVVNMPSSIEKIRPLLARNALLNDVRTLIESVDFDNEKATDYLKNLKDISEPNYLSACQQEIQRLIDVLDEWAKIQTASDNRVYL